MQHALLRKIIHKMEVIFLLIIISLGFVALLAGILYWSIRSGQFDDMERQGHQILMDDDDDTHVEDDETSN